MIADTAYGSGPMLGWLVDHKIYPYIPLIDKAGRPTVPGHAQTSNGTLRMINISAPKATRSNSSAGITLIRTGARRARAQRAIAP